MRLFQLTVIMGFFSTLFGCEKSTKQSGPFVSKSAFTENRDKQVTMTPLTMEQLRSHGINDSTRLKLEYFFYTNSKVNASALAEELDARGYVGGHQVAAGDPSLFVITGWTTPMLMTDAVVVPWSEEMCDVGYNFDCKFDGWGTNPNP